MVNSNARLGYHYYPDDRHYSQTDLETWLPILHSLGAKWMTLRSSAQRAIPEHFVRGLLQAGIQPIIHINSDIGALQLSDLTPLFSCYSRWGVRYVVVFDRPNLKASWGESAWSRRGLVERFLDINVPILEAARAAGLHPTLPPLEPGGDYWDTAFLEQTLKGLDRRGKRDLLDSLTLATYAWTFNRPLDWGIGGPERWPEARPYHTPLGCQDQRGLRVFDWYASVCRKIVASPLPMLVIAGGACSRDPQQSHLAPDVQAEQNLSIARSLESEGIPTQVLNYAFYPLTCEPGHPDHDLAWFPKVDQPRPVVSTFRRYVNAAEAPAVKQNTGKLIEHYVLLPADSGPSFHRRWAALGALTAASMPVVGFSPEVAHYAQRVTIIGDETLIPLQIEIELRATGCEVQRVPNLATPGTSGRHRDDPGMPSMTAPSGANHV
jgi:hypothetical protein